MACVATFSDSQPSLKLAEAVDLILSLPMCNVDIVHTPPYQSTMVQAFNTILHYLDSLITSGVLCHHCDTEPLTGLGILFRAEVLDKLFELRRVSLDNVAPSVGIASRRATLWVDILLAAIGDTVLSIMGDTDGRSRSLGPHPTFFKTHAFELSLCASTQLPGTFAAMPSTLVSPSASPAAVRLAIRLMYAVYILGPLIHGRDPWFLRGIQPNTLSRNLVAYMRDVHEGNSPVSAGSEQGKARRSMHAMAISLFAASELSSKDGRRALRPHAWPKIMGLIRDILQPMCLNGRLQLLETHGLDAAGQILLCSPAVISWIWFVWGEHRFTSADTAGSLVSFWLYHIGRCSLEPSQARHDWQNIIIRSVENYVDAVCSVMMMLTEHAVLVATQDVSTRFSAAALDTLFKTCWTMAYVLRSFNFYDCFKRDDVLKAFIQLLIVLGSEPSEIAVKDVIFDGLCHINKEALHSSMAASLEDPDFGATPKIERGVHGRDRLSAPYLSTPLAELSRLIHAFSAPQSVEVVTSDKEAAKQMLQLLALIWHIDIRDFISSEHAAPFIATIVQRASTTIDVALLNASITAFTAFEYLNKGSTVHNGCPPLWGIDQIWRAIFLQLSQDPILLPSLASYISVSANGIIRRQENLARAWDLMSDTLLVLLQRETILASEPLAEMTAVVCCVALHAIILHADHITTNRMLLSPWRRKLYESLGEVMRGSQVMPVTLYQELEKLVRTFDQIVGGVATHSLLVGPLATVFSSPPRPLRLLWWNHSLFILPALGFADVSC